MDLLLILYFYHYWKKFSGLSYLHRKELDGNLKRIDGIEDQFILLLTPAGHGALFTEDGHLIFHLQQTNISDSQHDTYTMH